MKQGDVRSHLWWGGPPAEAIGLDLGDFYLTQYILQIIQDCVLSMDETVEVSRQLVAWRAYPGAHQRMIRCVRNHYRVTW